MSSHNAGFLSALPARTAGTRRRALALTGLAALLLPLPGCQSVTGTPAESQVRIIDTSPDAPGLDVYQGTGILAYNLGLGTITSYVPLTPGIYSIPVDVSGTHQQAVSASGTFAANSQYTVLIGNYFNSLQELILKDQTTAAPAGEINLRFVDQSTRAGALDLYLIPTGSTILTVRPILTNITFNVNTGYMNVPPGTYTLVALPTGTVPTVMGTTSYTGTSVTYLAGCARTIVLIDTQVVTTPGLQAIIADDFDTPGSTS